MEQTSPFWIAGIGMILLILGYRAVRKKQILGSSGDMRSNREVSFYLRVGGFWLSGLLLMVLAATLFHKQYGWGILSVYLLLLALFTWVLLRFRTFRKGIGKITVKALTPKKRKPKPEKETTATPKAWALAASILPGSLRGLDHQTLAGRSLSSSNERKAQRWLKKEWEIDDAEEFEEVQDWLLETGHRTEFFEEIQRFRLFTEEFRAAFLGRIDAGLEEAQTEEEKEELKGRVLLAASRGTELTEAGFMAWDFFRYLDNCRAGYLAGYLEEEDAWDAMLSASQVLQSRYDSWEEAGEAFLAAREYWSVVDSERDGAAWRKAILQLKENPHSAWNQVPWDLSLFNRS